MEPVRYLRPTVLAYRRLSRPAHIALSFVALGGVLTGFSACRSSTTATGTPIEVSTRTAIPTLIIVTPTPAVPGQSGAVATAAPANPTPNPSTSGQNGSYTVRAGDTFYTIAVKFNVTVQALMKANSITDPTTLRAGQVIVIP